MMRPNEPISLLKKWCMGAALSAAFLGSGMIKADYPDFHQVALASCGDESGYAGCSLGDEVLENCGTCDNGMDRSCLECFGEQCYLFPQSDCGWNLRGWLNAGFIANTASPNSKFNGPYNAVDRANEAMFNQGYLIAEKALPECGFGVGGRVDLLYGEDFQLAQSVGFESRTNNDSHWNGEYYGLAFPQAYLHLGSQQLNLQLGHFYSVVGYEGVMAPSNFFYSKSYSYQFAGPFTHWGGQVNWTPNECWTFNLALTNGWNGFDRLSEKMGVVANAKYTSDWGAWTSFAIVMGDEFTNLAALPGIPFDFANRTRYSWLFGLPLTARFDYVFHQWLGTQENGWVGGDGADWYGLDQYLYYKINPCWKAGLRAEWFRDEEGTRVGLNRPRNPNNPPLAGDFFSIGTGLNWTPTHNLTVRPELRYDWFDGAAGVNPYNDGLDTNQFMFGLDAILLF